MASEMSMFTTMDPIKTQLANTQAKTTTGKLLRSEPSNNNRNVLEVHLPTLLAIRKQLANSASNPLSSNNPNKNTVNVPPADLVRIVGGDPYEIVTTESTTLPPKVRNIFPFSPC